MRKVNVFISFIFIGFSFILLGQETDTLSKGTKVDKKDTAKVHSPQRAARLSIMLPGAGQVYNSLAMPKGKKNAWWKVPIIYGALAGSGYLLVENHILQRDLKAEYEYRMDSNGTPNPDNPEFFDIDMPGVLQLYESHKGSRDMMLILFAAAYGLNILDALVEAHFVDFDVSDDLSLRIAPSMKANQNFGVSFALRFK